MLTFLKFVFRVNKKIKNHLIFSDVSKYILKICSADTSSSPSASATFLRSLINDININPVIYTPGYRLDGVSPFLERVVSILGLSNQEKIDFLLNVDDHEFDLKFLRSYYPNTPYNIVVINNRLFALGSFVTPIDVIIDLDDYSIYKIDSLKFDVVGASRLLLHKMLKSPPKYIESGCVNRKVLVCAKDSRPAHVFFDELSGYYSLRLKLKDKVQVGFSDFASYFEPDMIPGSIGVVDFNREVDVLSSVYILVRNHQRLQPECDHEGYRKWLVDCARKNYHSLINSLEGKIVIWLGITGGERRSWLEEKEGLTVLVKFFMKRYNNPYFVFDGYTGQSCFENQESHVHIRHHIDILDYVVNSCGLGANSYASLINSPVLKKVAYANTSSFYVTLAGTPSNWVSNIARVPGVLHGNTCSIKKGKLNYWAANSILFPVDLIRDEGVNYSKRDLARFGIKKIESSSGYYNYSICPSDMLDVVIAGLEKLKMNNEMGL